MNSGSCRKRGSREAAFAWAAAVSLAVVLGGVPVAHAQSPDAATDASVAPAVGSQPQPPGAERSPKTTALAMGAKLLQGNSPLGPMDVYLVGFHPMKEDPEHRMEAHHFCHQVNEGNSYGKTWHVWNTGGPGHRADRLPTGPAHLAWSFNRDGEAQPELVRRRDDAMDLDTKKTRQGRADLHSLARPQSGVDALNGKFARPTTPIPGVVDKNAGGR